MLEKFCKFSFLRPKLVVAQGLLCAGDVSTQCLKKSISDISDCNLKTNYQILIIFGKLAIK